MSPDKRSFQEAPVTQKTGSNAQRVQTCVRGCRVWSEIHPSMQHTDESEGFRHDSEESQAPLPAGRCAEHLTCVIPLALW